MTANDPDSTTATGRQLASRLTVLIGGLLANDVPARIGRRLAVYVAATERRLARRNALEVARAMIDPTRSLSSFGRRSEGMPG